MRPTIAIAAVIIVLAGGIAFGVSRRPLVYKGEVRVTPVAVDGRSGVRCSGVFNSEVSPFYTPRSFEAMTGSELRYAHKNGVGAHSLEGLYIQIKCDGYEAYKSPLFSWSLWRRTVDLGTVTLKKAS